MRNGQTIFYFLTHEDKVISIQDQQTIYFAEGLDFRAEEVLKIFNPTEIEAIKELINSSSERNYDFKLNSVFLDYDPESDNETLFFMLRSNTKFVGLEGNSLILLEHPDPAIKLSTMEKAEEFMEQINNSVEDIQLDICKGSVRRFEDLNPFPKELIKEEKTSNKKTKEQEESLKKLEKDISDILKGENK